MGNKIEVESSNIRAIKHNGEDNTLDVWFNNSGTTFYRYKDVDFITYSELLTAESVGKAFNEKVKHKEFDKMTEE